MASGLQPKAAAGSPCYYLVMAQTALDPTQLDRIVYGLDSGIKPPDPPGVVAVEGRWKTHPDIGVGWCPEEEMTIAVSPTAGHVLEGFVMADEVRQSIEVLSLQISTCARDFALRFNEDDLLVPEQGELIVQAHELVSLALRVIKPIERVCLTASGHHHAAELARRALFDELDSCSEAADAMRAPTRWDSQRAADAEHVSTRWRNYRQAVRQVEQLRASQRGELVMGDEWLGI